mgnify:CR=1 FL=1
MNTYYNLTVIEGVGDMNSPIPKIEFWTGLHNSEMLCLMASDEYIYVQSNDPETSCGFDIIDDISDNTMSLWRLYPNPTNKEVFLEVPSFYLNTEVVIDIYAIDGTLKKEYKLPNLQNSIIRLSIADLSDGLYIITFSNKFSKGYIDKLIINS